MHIYENKYLVKFAFVLIMEVVRTSETSAYLYETTRRCISERWRLLVRRYDNLTSKYVYCCKNRHHHHHHQWLYSPCKDLGRFAPEVS
jgi:hypothetical protein